MIPILQVFYSVFSGVMLAAAIPNEFYLLGCPVFTVLALVPLYIAVWESKNYKQAMLCFAVQTAATHLCSSFWLGFKDFAIFTLGFSAFGTALIGCAFALLLYLPFSSAKSKNDLNLNSLHNQFFNSITFRCLYFAGIYTLYEWIKSSGFLGYPWGTLSSTMYEWRPLMQIADITGPYGVSIQFALINAVIAELLIHFNKRRELSDITRLCAALFFVSLIYGKYQCSKVRIPQKTLSTIMVQQNSDPWKEKTDTEAILRSQEYTQKAVAQLKEKGEHPQLTVWSEGTLKHTFPANSIHYKYFPSEQPLFEFIEKQNCPFLIGGAYVKDYETFRIFNAALMFDSKANLRGVYGKNHLVPFAEAIPGAHIPAVRKFLVEVLKISAGWTPGDQYVYFEIPASYAEGRSIDAYKTISLAESFEQQTEKENLAPVVRIATPICFDDSFPDIMRPLFKGGAELFMNITDDSWSLKKSSEFQHFVIASYAAIEFRTTVARSTNSGYSVVLDPSAKILAEMPLFESASLACKIPVYERHITVYALLGNWLPYLLAVLLVCYSVFSFKTFEKTDYIPDERKIKKHKHKKHKK